jgi:hypothetical protein
MTREEHLQWCKDRALDYVSRGDLADAMASMMSDMEKHPGTAGHPAVPLMMSLAGSGHLGTPGELRKFIEDFG